MNAIIDVLGKVEGNAVGALIEAAGGWLEVRMMIYSAWVGGQITSEQVDALADKVARWVKQEEFRKWMEAMEQRDGKK